MIDVNDITKRLNRINYSIKQSQNYDILNKVRYIKDEKTGGHSGFFIESEPIDDSEYKIMIIIHAIASLKDHLKKINSNVEDVINSCLALMLIIDIDNADKHGYPSNRHSRSNLNPIITNINSKIKMNKGDVISYTTEGEIIFDEKTNEPYQKIIIVVDNFDGHIYIDADINDDSGNFIMTFEKMITTSLNEFEKIIPK